MDSYYPKIKDKNFNALIKTKNEFFGKPIKNLKDKFIIQRHQKFVKNFITSQTLYNKLILFHGTGKGKTCEAIQISEKYRLSLISPKIFIVCSSIARVNFIKELSGKCGSFANYNTLTHKDENKLIKIGYIFQNYQSFVKNRDGDITDSLIIIDEAHSLLNENTYSIALKRLMKTSKRYKLILMTATPMFNEPYDIVEFINLLYPNDLLDKYELFTIDNELKPNANKIIKSRLAGMISYNMYNDPKYFPTQIDIGSIPLKLQGPNNERIIQTKLIRVPLSKIQFEAYKKYWTGSVNMKIKKICEFVLPDMIFSKIENELKYVSIDYLKKYKITLSRQNVMKSSISGPVLNISNLGNYSSKYHKCISDILKNNRPFGFVFGKFVNNSGIKLFANAMIENGISEYIVGINLINNNNIDYKYGIKYKDWKRNEQFYPSKYIILHKDISIIDRNKLIKIFNSEENKNGKIIKYIIGSLLIKESLDLKRIHDIYILNVQENFSRVNQIIGRGIRFKSHDDIENKIVNIHKYVVSIPNSDKIMSSEELEYARDEKNYIVIKQIEKILKTIAIDYKFYDSSNITTNNPNLTYKLYYQNDEVFLAKLYIIDIINQYTIISRSIIHELLKKYSDTCFIDLALKELINNKNIFNDGFLIELSTGIFAFNPIDLNDNTLSLEKRINFTKPNKNININKQITTIISKRKTKYFYNINKTIKYLKTMTKFKLLALHLSKLQIEHQQNILEYALEKYINSKKNISKIIFNILKNYKNYLIDENMIKIGFNHSIGDNYFDTESFTQIDKTKKFIGHYLMMPRIYNNSLHKFVNLKDNEYLLKRKSRKIKKENDFIIGYIEKNNNNKMVFKLRFTNENISSDLRKIKKGFICNQINDKTILLKICKQLEVQVKKKETIKSLCKLIELDLREKQMFADKYKTGILWFYPYDF